MERKGEAYQKIGTRRTRKKWQQNRWYIVCQVSYLCSELLAALLYGLPSYSERFSQVAGRVLEAGARVAAASQLCTRAGRGPVRLLLRHLTHFGFPQPASSGATGQRLTTPSDLPQALAQHTEDTFTQAAASSSQVRAACLLSCMWELIACLLSCIWELAQHQLCLQAAPGRPQGCILLGIAQLSATMSSSIISGAEGHYSVVLDQPMWLAFQVPDLSYRQSTEQNGGPCVTVYRLLQAVIMQAAGGTVEPIANITGKKRPLNQPMWHCTEQRRQQGQSILYEEQPLRKQCTRSQNHVEPTGESNAVCDKPFLASLSWYRCCS